MCALAGELGLDDGMVFLPKEDLQGQLVESSELVWIPVIHHLDDRSISIRYKGN